MNRRQFLGAGAVLSTHATAAPVAGKLRAGAGMTNITPSLGASLGGYFTEVFSADNHDELWVKSLVLDNGETRLAIAVCDLCVLPADVVARAKEAMRREAGIAEENILIACTHTHSAPATMHIFQSQPDTAYLEWLAVRISDSVRIATARLQPARIGWAFTREDRIAFNRRYHMKRGSVPPNPFGQTDLVRTNPGVGNPDIVKPAGPIDPTVGVLAVTSADGNPIAVLGNYSLHYVGGQGHRHVSADYFAYWAEAVAQYAGEGTIAMLSNGCQGDINNIDVRQPAQRQPPYTRMKEVAGVLAGATVRAIKAIEFRDDVSLGASQEWLNLGVRLPSADDVGAAKKTLSQATSGPPYKDLPLVYARETLLMADTFPQTMPVAVQALRAGDLALAAFSGEPFVELGLEVRAKSPIRALFPIGLANGHAGYLPTLAAHEQGGYETWRAKTSFLEKEAAPKVVAAMLRCLGRLA